MKVGLVSRESENPAAGRRVFPLARARGAPYPLRPRGVRSLMTKCRNAQGRTQAPLITSTVVSSTNQFAERRWGRRRGAPRCALGPGIRSLRLIGAGRRVEIAVRVITLAEDRPAVPHADPPEARSAEECRFDPLRAAAPPHTVTPTVPGPILFPVRCRTKSYEGCRAPR